MTRNLKVLALVLATAFTFTALASAALAATHHFTGTVGTPLKVIENNEQVVTTTTGGKEGFRCKQISVNGKVGAATSTEVTVEPFYTNCETEGELAAVVTVEPNGCHYTFFGTTTTGNPTGGEHANVEINCNTTGSEGIKNKITALKLACVLVPPQLVKHAVRYVDLENNKVEIQVTAHGFEIKTEGSCKNKEGVGENQIHSNGSYTGNITVEGGTLTTNAT